MDFQFYPTPQRLAARAWDKFKKPVALLLEPQAGKGDLVTAHTNGYTEIDDEELNSLRQTRSRFGHRHVNPVKWHACEINPTMHPILTDLGAEVVGYDFLQMESAAIYSHILGNPPFADGDSHLLHAWNILYGGEIVFILNAETIRNPYSAQRQRLVNLIEKHGSVEFLQEQFVGEMAERRTDVEIALVYLYKEAETVVNMDAILEGLKPAKDSTDMYDAPALNALALPGDFIERVVVDYEIAVQAAKAYAESSAVFGAAERRLGHTFQHMQSKGTGAETRPAQIDLAATIRETLGNSLQELRARAWGQVLRSTKLLELLSSAGRKNVESQFESISKLEFTRANIHGFLAGILQSMGDINKEMVLNLFDMIMQRETDNACFYQSWKSNEKHKALGMRIKRTRFILPLAQYESSADRYIPFGMKQTLSDIDKVFRILDGKNVQEGYGVLDLFNNSLSILAAGQRLDSDYFSVRYYPGKGTVHFFPRRMDVVERLNRYVGQVRQWLPPEMEQANADFVKQYDQAEKLSEDYIKKAKESRALRYMRHPAYLLVGKAHNKEEIDAETDRFSEVIAQVLEEKGIHPFNAITASVQTPQLTFELVA